MLNKEDLENDYHSLLDAIKMSNRRGNFEKSLELIDLASKIAYFYSINENFNDVKLENFISQIAKEKYDEVFINGEKNKVLFYDYFGFDNRGLTQQYLRALIALQMDIVYILEQSNNHSISQNIFDELNAYPKSIIYCLKKKGNLEKVTEVIEVIKYEKPSKVFFHIAPWDVVACTVFNVVKGMKRYQINLTDHAFWLGKNITDINIDFRSFGYNLALSKRRVDKQKLRILPYYPIISQHAFEGLPDETKGKKIIFSGGAFYKILGEKLIFLQLIKKLLAIDPELVFVFAGHGNQNPILKFAKENGFENKIFLIGDRKDISSIFKHVDYYLATFPFIGGLMCQIAAANKTPIFFFSKADFQCNDLSDIFFKNNNIESFDSIDSLRDRFQHVYNDKEFLNNYGVSLQQGMITPSEFADALQQILDDKDPFSFLKRHIDIDGFQKASSRYLIESENLYNPQYKDLIYAYLGTSSERRVYLRSFYKREQYMNLKADKVQFMKNIFRVIFPKVHRRVW